METVPAAIIQPEPPNSASDRASPGKGRRPELAPLSIYHEPWWLDIATDEQWGEVTVTENGTIVGRLPYPIARRFGLRMSLAPSLIRTLGPAVLDTPGKPVAALRRRLEITNDLIGQLPPFDVFEQLFDPSIPDAVSFIHRGFVAGTTYCFRIEAGQSEAQLWSRMNDKTRNVIRKSGKTLVVTRIEQPDAFVRFYETNLDGTNHHGTRRLVALLEAMLARGAGILLGAHDEAGRLVAATAIPWDSAVAHFLLCSRRRDAAAGATSLLIWEAARVARERGIIFDLDGVTSPSSLLFLSGFGGRMVQRLRVRRHTSRFRIAKGLRLLT
jgi:hypothetical protein